MSDETKQKIFDKVAVHLLRQMQQSRVGGRCMYRHPGGLMCGIGILIADKDYNEEMELNAASDLTFEGEILEPLHEYSNFMNRLQDIHDVFAPEEWKSQLERFAAKEVLVMPNPDNFPNPLIPGLP